MRNLLVITLLLFGTTAYALAADSLTIERGRALRQLLYQDCGSCHGMRLTGGLGPALTRDAIIDKSREYLVSVIRDGRPGTPMPPWKGLLSAADINWLVTILQYPDTRL